jgi:hypothetical protein
MSAAARKGERTEAGLAPPLRLSAPRGCRWRWRRRPSIFRAGRCGRTESARMPAGEQGAHVAAPGIWLKELLKAGCATATDMRIRKSCSDRGVNTAVNGIRTWWKEVRDAEARQTPIVWCPLSFRRSRCRCAVPITCAERLHDDAMLYSIIQNRRWCMTPSAVSRWRTRETKRRQRHTMPRLLPPCDRRARSRTDHAFRLRLCLTMTVCLAC